MATKKTTKAKYSKDLLLALYHTMLRIRSFEQHVSMCAEKGLIPAAPPLSLGREAAAAGAFAALQPQDYFTSGGRCHGHIIARGGDVRLAMAELFGKKSGYCRGRSGSMQLTDMAALHHLGCCGGPETGQAIAVGSALASRSMGEEAVTVACLGDEDAGEMFDEALALSAAEKLPLVFLIERSAGNGAPAAARDLSGRTAARGVPFASVNGSNATDVYAAMKAALEHARSGRGPYVVEAQIPPPEDLAGEGLPPRRSRANGEKAPSGDGLAQLRARLRSAGVKNDQLDALLANAREEMDEAVEYAAAAPLPDPAQAAGDLYTADNERCVAR